MAGIDTAAIGFSIAIVAIGVGFAFYMSGVQDAGPVSTAPIISSNTADKAEAAAKMAAADAEAAAKMAAADAEAAAKMAAADAEAAAKAAAADAEAAAKMAAETISGPQNHTVEIPVGTASPGCENSNACYLPADITINAGDTVTWDNVDTAAHTVTGGSPADGPSGVFDSSLVMGKASYAFTFEEAGSYDYFCMVHPWMVGSVTVN